MKITQNLLLIAFGFCLGLTSLFFLKKVQGIGTDGVIYACYSKNPGFLRFIKDTETCNSNETAISWNKESRPGFGGYVRNLSYVSFYRENLSYHNFSGGIFVGTNFTQSNLNMSDLSYADLTNAVLAQASLTGVNLTGVTWSNTTCPDGSNSDGNGGTCEGHLNP